MKSSHLLHCLLIPAAVFSLAGCAGDNDVSWGEEAGGGGTQFLQASAANGQTVRTGSVSADIISATVAIIAQHDASEHQREVTVERGQHWASHHVAAVTEHRHHFIAVDTAIDARTDPSAKKSVMIFDTDAQKVVGKKVYDVQSPPDVGTIARFDTYSAQYVGTGL